MVARGAGGVRGWERKALLFFFAFFLPVQGVSIGQKLLRKRDGDFFFFPDFSVSLVFF